MSEKRRADSGLSSSSMQASLPRQGDTNKRKAEREAEPAGAVWTGNDEALVEVLRNSDGSGGGHASVHISMDLAYVSP